MCSANALPYSNSNSSDPLFSVDNAVTYPCSIRIAEDARAEFFVDQDSGTGARHALEARRRLP